ncbi:MAG: hypothetical protein QOI98_2844 [Solirubrobacteraceae bacterium]|jgi:hypothetical protein|nr:hypothetical protein [Solirubrobacteraceae bacterium]
MLRSARAAAAVAAAATALASGMGCAAVALERDHGLRFLSPPEGARVTLPLVIRWKVDPQRFRPTGFDGSRSGHRGVYAVFVDSAPMRPGRHLDTLAAGDKTCQVSPGCPDATWLADHGVYVVRRPELALRGLPVAGGRAAPGGRRHRVTVVLLDGRGVRAGEAAWSRSFVAPKAQGG